MDDKRFRQIFLMLDSDQTGERESALGRLHALRPRTGWPSFRTILEASEGKLTDSSDRLRELGTENADLRAQNELLRAKIARTRKLFELRDAVMARPRPASSSRWLMVASLATVFFFAMGYLWEPGHLTRDAGAFLASSVNSLFVSSR